jgi:hypothetical protein
MKGKLLISSIVILFAFACDENEISDSQANKFIKFYKNYPEFTAAGVTQTETGYAFLGTSKPEDFPTDICFIRTDEYGNSIDSARYFGRRIDDQVYDDRAICLQQTNDGGFAILGSSSNPLTEKQDVYFIRTGPEGNLIWSTVISGTGNIEARHFEINNEGSFILTGYAEDEGKIKEIWIGCIGSEGNVIFSKNTPSNLDAVGQYIQILDNGNFIITGWSKNNPANIPNTFVLETTSTGGPRDIIYFSSTADEEGNCIRVLDDTHFQVLTTSKTTTGSDIQLHNVDFSSYPHTNTEKALTSSGKNIGRCMQRNSNSIYVLGTIGTTSANNTAITLITTDASGNQLTRSDFGIESELSASSFEQTSDGGFIILGTNRHAERNIAVALIKLNADALF